MKVIRKATYTLLLGKDSCELFKYFDVDELYGFSLKECTEYNNSGKEAYIKGMSNYIPKRDGDYKHGDDFFVFINTSSCTSYLSTILLINREMMHRAFELYNWDMEKEEEIISWAEKQTAELATKLKTVLFVLR